MYTENVHYGDGGVNCDVDAKNDNNATFQIEWMPEVLHPIILAIQKHSKAPLGMISLLVDSVISMAIGKGLGIYNQIAGFRTLGNIQVLIGMPSGSGKSAAGKAAFKAFDKCEDLAHQKFRKEVLPEILTELEDIKQRIASLKGKGGLSDSQREDYQKLIQRLNELEGLQQKPQFHMDDATIPAMESILEWNNGVGSLFTLDGRKAINNILGLSSYGSRQNVTAESIFLYGFSQDPIVTNRVGGRNIDVQRPCLTSCILAQPDKVDKALLLPELKDSGFLPRQLIYMSNSRQPKKEQPLSVPEGVETEWESLISDLFSAYRTGEDARSKEHTNWIMLSSEQSEMIWDYTKQVDEKICVGERAILQETATRLPEQAVKLALIHHAAMHRERAHQTPIDDATIANAIHLTEWQFSGYQELVQDEAEERDWKIIKKAIEYAKTQDSRSIKPRDMQLKRWISDASEGTRLLEKANEHFQRVEKPRSDGKSGRGSISYMLRE